MTLRRRAMVPADIPECVEIIASHPVGGPRYGPWIEQLPQALRRLLEGEAGASLVILASDGPRAPICWAGVSAIVRDDFLWELKRPPHFWVSAELTRRIVNGESPLLSSKELREENSRGGLNLVCWDGCARLGYESNGEMMRYMMSGFIEAHRGYLWKEMIATQHSSTEHLVFDLKTGGYFWDPTAGGYTSTLPEDPAEIIRKPHVVGCTRDMDRGDWAASWVGTLFDYHPPVLGFNRSEQRLLTCALQAATDEQAAATLGISLSAVKKLWISIYSRLQDGMPVLIAEPVRSDVPASGRGKEKRRRLLEYVREHPEELRPVSRRLLREHLRALSA